MRNGTTCYGIPLLTSSKIHHILGSLPPMEYLVRDGSLREVAAHRRSNRQHQTGRHTTLYLPVRSQINVFASSAAYSSPSLVMTGSLGPHWHAKDIRRAGRGQNNVLCVMDGRERPGERAYLR
jgi:hypothetical protein